MHCDVLIMTANATLLIFYHFSNTNFSSVFARRIYIYVQIPLMAYYKSNSIVSIQNVIWAFRVDRRGREMKWPA